MFYITGIMRLYIGSYDEDELDIVMQDLRKAGIKTELRPSLDVHHRVNYFIEGELNNLKKKYKDDLTSKILKEVEEDFERARVVMKDGIDIVDFEEQFLDLRYPERKRYKNIKKIMEEISSDTNVIDEDVYDKLIEKIDEKELNEYLDQFYNEMNFMTNFHNILEENGIKYDNENGKMHGSIYENPHVKIYIDADIENAEKIGLEKEFETFIDKNIDVYANLIDVIYEIDKVEKLCRDKPEYSELLFMANLIGRITKKIKGKKDINELIEEISSISEKSENIYLTPSAIKDILKTMEKAEIIKIKNGKVMLRK